MKGSRRASFCKFLCKVFEFYFATFIALGILGTRASLPQAFKFLYLLLIAHLNRMLMKKVFSLCILIFLYNSLLYSQNISASQKDFTVKGFHLDLRIQVMTMPALKAFAEKLSKNGINTLIMEWEGTFPFQTHPVISNRYAYTKAEIKSFIQYCSKLGIDVIPLQQSFGHVEYILRNYRYKNLREDQKDYSQVCPLEVEGNKELFSDLFSELAAMHPSKYFHIGGDETYLLGHCDKCKAKAEKEGKSKLYIDHIKMLCDIVIRLGKRPVLWADIALKHPEGLALLPKETILVDWNYGWDINRFGDHNKLQQSGFEVWGAPALRSQPDNYYLTQWEKHFKNIRDFVPTARQLSYKGIIMTSWSTSGLYSPVFESTSDIIDLYPIRHAYPLSGFNLLLAAYIESIHIKTPLGINGFVQKYCREQYGLSKAQIDNFWEAITMTPYEVNQGEVISSGSLTQQALLDSARQAAKLLYLIQPSRNKQEFEHYRVMADIRVLYLTYQTLEKRANAPDFNSQKIPSLLKELKTLRLRAKELDWRFVALNKTYYYPSELKEENKLRDTKIELLYERLAKERSVFLGSKLRQSNCISQGERAKYRNLGNNKSSSATISKYYR
jgi:hexosaminidase